MNDFICPSGNPCKTLSPPYRFTPPFFLGLANVLPYREFFELSAFLRSFYGCESERRKYRRFIVDSEIFGVSLAETFAYKPLLA
ncbi:MULTISPECIES: hypothetical protein [unclassified Sinorhizobium]|uniref:hypothetical protein n=1 Tax=unclassified Sinorhizobium TaxID=2613772 RepID=UPI0024C2E00E|nr:MULTISPECIES: hypothetical protein [unclassified Sinorhizobium]MDK1372975.1 hypothetical protein [Sinorhizobium sp. 6-70]MDK1477466.1 hypothetical protein [Sinorhizobium sp. 6-117]